MELRFQNKLIQKLCSNYDFCRKKKGAITAKQLHDESLIDLKAATHLGDIKKMPWHRLHPLKGDRAGQYAMDLDQPKRLIIEPIDAVVGDYINTNAVLLVEIADNYH